MRAWDGLWDTWFAREGVTPLRLDYDTLAQDPRATLRRVLNDLRGDTGMVDGLPIPTGKLADATSREWVRWYRREIGQG